MKQIMLTIITLLISSSLAMANIYVDGMLLINNAGDAKTQSGFGLKVATDLTNDFNIFVKQSFTNTTEHPNTINETDYMQLQGFLGAEYIYAFKQIPCVVTLSAGVGVSHTEITPQEQSSGLKDLSETGLGSGIWLSGQWLLTQWFAPFIEIGYTKSMYTTDLKDASIGGMQFLFGIRFTVWGKNKSLLNEYE